MNPAYRLSDPAGVFSPSLIFFPELIRQNIARVIEMAGGPDRLRPHVKTHKTREIARMLLDAGVTRHKCATIAEAEMLAAIGAPDVLIAYPLVGPNVGRLAELITQVPRHRVLVAHRPPGRPPAHSRPRSPQQGLKVGVMTRSRCRPAPHRHRGRRRGAVAVRTRGLAARSDAQRLPALRRAQ